MNSSSASKTPLNPKNKRLLKKKKKTDEKITQLTETLNNLTAFMMDQTNNSKSSPTHKDK